MCTVSFIARKSGYALAMNRDEKLTRPAGLAPSQKTINGHLVMAPSEPGGGTWISVNDGGVSFALINWYSISARVNFDSISRGQVVNAVCSLASADAALALLGGLPLAKINPFRLMGIFPAQQEVVQWQWDRKKLVRKNHHWQNQQWISSGFDEASAQRIRSETFEHAARQPSADTLEWLRRLHRSHAPKAGPFSTCMHRDDASTVSYTEVSMSPREVTMRYHTQAPCQCSEFDVCCIPLNATFSGFHARPHPGPNLGWGGKTRNLRARCPCHSPQPSPLVMGAKEPAGGQAGELLRMIRGG